VSLTPRPLFTPGKDPVPIVQEVGWAPGPVWTGAENLAPTRIRSPDRPARSKSPYRLRYPAHKVRWHIIKYNASTLLGVIESQEERLLNKIILLADIDGCVTSYGDPVFYVCRGLIRVSCNIGFMLGH
jgi:hypothetical protein